MPFNASNRVGAGLSSAPFCVGGYVGALPQAPEGN